MKLILLICSVLFVINLTVARNIISKFTYNEVYDIAQDSDWYKKTVFYQIYPRSFKDSDGDGVGDLQGIIQSLSHLKEAGVSATWLSPIFKSPMVDFGYDIADYRDVDPIFGTLDDLKQLIEKAHELEIKIILDFVPNHSSDEHEWFVKSENEEIGYEDYYVWHSGHAVEGQEIPDLPNNWLSVFSGPAWTWSPKRKQYYLHQFTPEQPDLNFRNMKVQQEMKDILTFWINLGVDGFRIDAINHMLEDEFFRDEPIADPPTTTNPNNHAYLNHIYTKDLEGCYDVVAEWRKILDDYTLEHPEEGQKVILTEANTDFDRMMRWFGTEQSPISHIPFNFDFISDLNLNSTADDVKQIVDKWLNRKPSWASANWVMGNHDKNRIGSRYGQNRIDALNMFMMTLPGICVTYYGDEIGMVDNSAITWEETQDPQACQTNDPENYQLYSRDPARTPFQWDSTPQSGFSTAAQTWLPVNPNYLELNLANQKNSPNSHFRLYQQLTKLRQEEEFLNGEYISIATNNILVYKRSIMEEKGYGIAINFGNSVSNVNLENLGLNRNFVATVISATGNSNKVVQSRFVPVELQLQPYEGIIFQYSQIQDSDWWKKTVFYQIYPRSFKDSDGDGVGDLQGIIQNLPHLKEAGVSATWLSPIFPSPMVDFGYDISDYRDVDPVFGTLNDLLILIDKAHELGIKIILDFVPNHSSNKHEWFIKSENREIGYEDYYVWHSGKMIEGQELPGLPNNWLSVFSGSAWTWSPKRNQYYLHQFTPEQPDLNFRNEKVQQEMKDILKYWINFGVDGFRIDAINHMLEDEQFRDEPVANPSTTTNPNNHGYLNHIYTKDLEGCYDVVAEWRKILDDYTLAHPEEGQKVIMTEAATDFNRMMRWYGTEEVPISHIPFNFDFISDLNSDSTAPQVSNIIDKWLNEKPYWTLANWVLSNHDKNRIGSRFGQTRIDALNMFMMTLPGICVTYYGDEIGMVDNSAITWEETQDPQACQTNDPENYQLYSRDPARTPFQWDSTPQAGFSTAAKTWLPVNPNYPDLNLARQKNTADSHFKLYQQLTKLRQEEEFQYGDYNSITTNNVLVYQRSVVKEKGYGVAINFGNSVAEVKLESLGLNRNFVATIISVSKNSNKIVQSQFVPVELQLLPYEGIIFQYIQYQDPDWWKKTVFYQIYPRSFKDSDGDGVGDIQGIIENLEHLKEAGIGATWLSPIFPSPMIDFGYDISDYLDVDPTFGTLADLMQLVERAHELGIKIILDLVPNHSSDKHEWFTNSVNKEEGYEDYYIWRNGIAVEGQEIPNPPNNWISVFSGSAWTWNSIRKQYYLHQFAPEQPDLNFRNERVLQEMKNIIVFWLEFGIDGFRIDSTNYVYEDSQFRDEPIREPAITTDKNSHDYLNHIYTKDVDENLNIGREWRKIFDEFSADHPELPPKVMMTEAYAGFDSVLKWYGTEEEPISHIPFNFEFIMEVTKKSTADNIKKIIDKRLIEQPSWALANWVFGNHDRSRVASRYSSAQVDSLNMLLLLLPGIAVTYYGEEIGMEDYNEITWEETQDPQACMQGDPNIYLEYSRDPVRTPFQWDTTKNAGFSENDRPWLPIHTNYLELNLATQKSASVSHYKLYTQLTELRQKEEFLYGNYKSISSNNVLVFTRSTVSEKGYGVAINLGSGSVTADLSQLKLPIDSIATVVGISQNSQRTVGTVFDPFKIQLQPYEGLIFHYISSPKTDPPVKAEPLDWWKNTVFYQIYPRSFKDSDGDGIGDLKGIISKLEHLKDAGVGATWLSPFFKSPMVDFGYDISDYYDVEDIFGDMDDVKNLITKARELGIKIILDLVPNHTSDKHEWFKRSVRREGVYTDYYIWHDGIAIAGQEIPNPPNNWISVFSGSAWTWNDVRKQYYLHQFTPEQPDLDFRNELVRIEMENVIKYWMDLGVDGFRIDAINHMFEIEDFRDEPLLNPSVTNDKNNYGYLDHIYTKDLQECYDVVASWRKILDEHSAAHPAYPTKIMMTEAWVDLEKLKTWYGTETKPISHIPFNFVFLDQLYAESSVSDIKTAIDARLANTPDWASINWVLGNHDKTRVATKYGSKRVDSMNILLMTLPGIAITYNGEEIGMENNDEITWDETKDPQACQTGDENNLSASRDPVRTPFQWDNTKNAGFSTAASTWLPVHDNYLGLNLKIQKEDKQSHFKTYQTLTKLRQNTEFTAGQFTSKAMSDVFAYTRSTTNGKTYGIAINFGSTVATINMNEVQDLSKFSNPQGEILVASDQSYKVLRQSYPTNALPLQPNEALVFEIKSFGTKLTVSITLIVAVIFRNLL